MQPSTRQLVAIMFTDIVGYTAIMQQDEQKARDFRARHREIFEKTTQKHQGKILQYYGDGTLSIFNSAVAATQCAVELQLLFISQKIPVRIGIHTGDVAYDNQDIVGDGVNIASRIESLAQSGAVLISEKAYDEIKNHKDLPVQSLGNFHFKNVAKPMKVYAMAHDGLHIPSSGSIRGKLAKASPQSLLVISMAILALILVTYLWWQKNQKSAGTTKGAITIAVLPFENMSNDPDQEYFTDGVTEDIITKLSFLDNIRVSSRTSTKRFKNSSLSIMEIASQLGVSHILEGSVRRDGDQLRIVAQLIRTDTDDHVWAQTYDQKLSISSLFDIQSDVAAKIYTALEGTIIPTDSLQNALPTTSLAAYEHYLKGLYHYRTFDFNDLQLAIQYYDSAIALDPGYAEAYSSLGHAYAIAGTGYGWLKPDSARTLAKANCLKSLELKSTLGGARTLLGDLLFWYEYNWQEAEIEYRLAMELDPKHTGNLISYALMLVSVGREDEVWPLLERSYQLEPNNVLVLTTSAWVNLYARRYDEVQRLAELAIKIDPELHDAYQVMGYSYLFNGQIDNAKKTFKNHSFNQLDGFVAGYTGNLDSAQMYVNIVLEDEKQMYVPPMTIAWMYAGMKDIEGAMRWLNKAYENGDRGLIFLKVFPVWDGIRDHPEFKALVEKVGI